MGRPALQVAALLFMENPIWTLLYELFVEPPLRMMQRAFDRNHVVATMVPVPPETAKCTSPKLPKLN
jgi:hypothetical protein